LLQPKQNKSSVPEKINDIINQKGTRDDDNDDTTVIDIIPVVNVLCIPIISGFLY
jgi:hypothetical protein